MKRHLTEKAKAYHKDWVSKNRDKTRAYGRKWSYANRKKVLEKNRQFRLKNPEKFRVWDRKKRGLPDPTRPDVGVCEICGTIGSFMNLDHCHATDAFRGWLCGNCNRGLGQFKDNINVMEKAVIYLKSFVGTLGES